MPSHLTFERIVALAADLFDTPVAVLALKEGGGWRVAAGGGRDGEVFAEEAPSSGLPFGAAEIRTVPDATRDAELHEHPLMAGPRPARFYAGAPLLDGAGGVIGTLCVLDDRTRAAPSARDMGRLAALAQLARDAVEAMRAVDRAEDAVRAKTELLADVSHELRTPLNGIMGFAEILGRGDLLDADARLGVARIQEAGRGLLGIVGDALDLSRPASEGIRLTPQPFSVTDLVEHAVAIVRPEAERKGLRLVVDLPRAPFPSLVGDPDRLRQVLLNLLSNAVKFTPSGTVRASLAVDEDAPRSTLLPLTFSVEDSGIGIAGEGIPRLFRRFAQAHDGVARRFGGTGLGLAISKALVEAMGGTIAVESAPGVGARFSVSLALPRAVDHRASPPARPTRRVEYGALKGMSVLLAEDMPLNQKLVTQMLEPFGADVDVVADGAAAVAAAGRGGYALVLMDMEMPVLGGLDATRAIRALGGAAGAVPIVALTANVFPEHLDLCRAAGMDDHLTKPFGADELGTMALRWGRRAAPAEDGETLPAG